MRPVCAARHLPAGVAQALPIPIVMDRRCRLPIDCKLIKNYSTGGGRQPWVVYSRTDDDEVLKRKEKLEAAGARTIESADNGKWPRLCQVLRAGLRKFPAVAGVLHALHSLGIRSLMVEGGAQIIDAFARSGLVDRLVVTVAPVVVGSGGIGYTLDLARLSFQASEGMGIDHVISFRSK